MAEEAPVPAAEKTETGTGRGTARPGQRQLFLGTFIHSKTADALEYLEDTAVAVDATGVIVAVERGCGSEEQAKRQLYPRLGWTAAADEVVVVHAAGPGRFFFPGFIDTHIHAPQFPNSGLFGQSTLLDWLNTYTFPMEASLAALPKARRVYRHVVARTLAHGTTTAAYYATIDVAATNLLADLCLAAGQRAFVGRVCMDRLGPDYYVDEGGPDAVLARTQETVDHVRRIDPAFDLVAPIVTPRFAPACTPETLARLGRLARDEGLAVQTHLGENTAEGALVRELFPEAPSYTAVYDAAGLLTARTVLAHAVHLSEAEVALIRTRGAGVAHCPCSNAALTSGEARVRWLLDGGVAVGLGTDVSGGFSPSVLDAARHALLVSRHLAMPYNAHGDASRAPCDVDAADRARAPLAVPEVLHLATRGGARLLGLADRVGAFEVGMQWDAQLVALHSVPGRDDGEEDDGADGKNDNDGNAGNVSLFGWETWEECVAKWLFNGDDRNTKKVWVKGRLVHSRS